MATVDDSRGVLARDLPQGFAKLREALRPLVGDLSRVVYTSYANPTLSESGGPCPGGRAGFEIHPSFNAEPRRLATVSAFVQNEFLPQLKAIALCQAGILCRNPQADRMTFVDSHQAAFAGHGFCARAQSDPEFDRECFAANGESFDPDIVTAANQPMLCGRGASEYRPYLPRARWIRDANDSYFAAMTYPQGVSNAPTDIHDATWGVLSAVYGGAVHPSAEGHAVMADAACRPQPQCCSSRPRCPRKRSASALAPSPPPGCLGSAIAPSGGGAIAPPGCLAGAIAPPGAGAIALPGAALAFWRAAWLPRTSAGSIFLQ